MEEDPEIKAMSEVHSSLKSLESPEAQQRVLDWVSSKLGLSMTARKKQMGVDDITQPADTQSSGKVTIDSFDSSSELLSKIDVSTKPQRALVVAAYLHKKLNVEELTGQQINKELKNIGHGSSNITNDIAKNIAKKPQLMIQTKKGGSSQQAHKKVKVTTAGFAWVEGRLNAQPDE